MTDSDQLRLRPAAEAFVSGERLIFRGSGGSKEVTFADASTAARCHDALREGSSIDALVHVVGWGRAAIDELVALLAREGLLVGAIDEPRPCNRVVIVGVGELALAITERARALDMAVAPCAEATPDTLTDVDVVVCVLEHPDDDRIEAIAARCEGRTLVVVEAEAHGTAVCTFRAWGGSGPLLGCSECRRRHLARRDPLRRHLAEHPPDRPPQWRHHPSAAVRELVIALCIAAITRVRRPNDRASAEECFVLERTAELVREPVVRAPCCSRCDRPAMLPGAELFAAVARRWHAALREDREPLALPELGARLRRLHGTRTGLVAHLEDTTAGHQHAALGFLRERGAAERLPECFARLRSAIALLPGRERMLQGEGFDFTADRCSAEALATIEGLERMFALDSFPIANTFTATHRSLAARAIDPEQLQLYSETQYASAGFPYRRFDRDAAIRWVVGTRWSDAEPIAVPYDAVAGGIGSLCQATSSGAAAHSSLRAAVLASTLEAVERDAFLVGWLARLQRPRLDCGATTDPLGLQAVLERAGLAITYVDVSTDTGVPVVMQVARDRHNPDFFVANTASGSSPAHAIGKLLRELVQVSLGYMRDRQHLCGPASASDDPRAVECLAQHLQFHQRREHNRHADFLDASSELRPIGALAWHSDDASAGVLARLHASGFDPIVVDCTPEPLAALGLVIVRAIVPGLTPLYSGYLRRRLGGRRIFEAPRRMGLRVTDLAEHELNPWPHPGA